MLPSVGGAARRLTDLPVRRAWWDTEGKQFHFARVNGLWRQPVSGGPATLVASFDGAVQGLASVEAGTGLLIGVLNPATNEGSLWLCRPDGGGLKLIRTGPELRNLTRLIYDPLTRRVLFSAEREAGMPRARLYSLPGPPELLESPPPPARLVDSTTQPDDFAVARSGGPLFVTSASVRLGGELLAIDRRSGRIEPFLPADLGYTSPIHRTPRKCFSSTGKTRPCGAPGQMVLSHAKSPFLPWRFSFPAGRLMGNGSPIPRVPALPTFGFS